MRFECFSFFADSTNLILESVRNRGIFNEMLRGNKSDCTMLILGIRKKALVSKKLRVNPKRFEKLIISLRTASYPTNLVLDKEQTSYPDILDALRLNLLNHPLRITIRA